MRLVPSLVVLLALFPLALRSMQAQTVQVIESTADEHELLVRSQLALAATAPAAKINIAVRPTVRMQTMDGFGASLTDSSASLIAHLPPAERDRLMHEVFAPDGPLGLTLLRQPIGASDFSAQGDYSYDDAKGDTALAKFSVKQDEPYLFPLLREAEHLNPQLRVMALPWSAPAWMKSSGSMKAGALEDRYLEVYARYLAKTVEAFHAQGVPVFALSLQNEPMNENPSYPTQAMSPMQQARLAAALQPMLTAAGRAPLLFGYEHNWNHLEYPTELLADAAKLKPAGGLFAGISFHCYGGSEAAQSAFLHDHPGTRLWFTECSAINSSPFAETFLWQAHHLLLGAPLNGARSVLLWNILLDGRGDPHNGGCDQCTGLLTLDRHGAEVRYRRTAGYYLMAHAAPYVHPGATHIGAVVTGSTSVLAEAFENLDGTTALLVLNEAPSPSEIALDTGAGGAAYTLPAHALVTFTWGTSAPALLEGTYRLTTSDSKALTATAGRQTLALATADGSPNQIWTVRRLASGRYEVRNVATAQALAVTGTGALTALIIDGEHTAALPIHPVNRGFCIAATRTPTCVSTASGTVLPGNLLLTPAVIASPFSTDK